MAGFFVGNFQEGKGRIVMLRLINVQEHERGLWFRRGQLQDVILPGSTWLLNWQDKIMVVDTIARPQFDHPLIDQLLDEPALRRHLEIVELDSSHWAMVWKDGEIISIVGPGRHAFWKTPGEFSVETFSIAQNVPQEIVKRVEPSLN
jgi:hypothetical protein